MFIVPLLNNIIKLIDKRGICDRVNDDNLSESIYHSSLLIGLEGYRNYNQTAQLLGISKEYLYTLISNNKDEIGEPFHHSVLSQSKLLSLFQIKKIKDILNK